MIVSRPEGSKIASLLFFLAILRQHMPQILNRHFQRCTKSLVNYFQPYLRITFDEFSNHHFQPQEAYELIEAYLSENSTNNAKKLKAEMVKHNKNSVQLSMDDYERVVDVYNGAKVWWVLSKSSSLTPDSYFLAPSQEKRFYWLTFHKRDRELITKSYLEHVIKQGREVRVKNRQTRLYTNGYASNGKTLWSHVVFDHPATFDTLAMDDEKKKEIVEDLSTFTKSKEYYTKIGKAWKRGYLLYGPPGTGKSTMIAAMANFLEYDVYDLELTAVKDNTELRKLLIETTSKSIIVIEDIDCSIDLTGKRPNDNQEKDDDHPHPAKNVEEKGRNENKQSKSKVTLSGLLNFIDGLWSSCGGERIIVFTTNYVEKLDPALIRRGRMDKHIELSYCSFQGFKLLAKNYLDIEMHPLFDTIHGLISDANISPADVAENIMRKSMNEDEERCLVNLIKALEEAKEKEKKRKMQNIPNQKAAKQQQHLQVKEKMIHINNILNT